MNRGDRIRTTKASYTIQRRLGEGGQGRVFLLKEAPKVAKLYWNFAADVLALQRRRLQKMIDQGPPSEAFVWPEDIVELPSLGYTMPYVDRLTPLARTWRSDHVRKVDLRTRLRLCYRLVDAFSKLHLGRGYAYADLSGENILCDITNGDVRLVDNDNLSVGDILPPIVQGTYRHKAPEIQSGKVRYPNVESDLHSLAVLIFETLLLHHPLLGDKVHDNADLEDAALGKNGLYIYHPTDSRNRYTRYKSYGGVTIDILPKSTQALFREIFVDGLHQPTVRVRENRWKREIINQLDLLVKCSNPHCPFGWTFISEPPEPSGRCVWCRNRWRDLTILRFTRPGENEAVRHKVVRDGDYIASHHCKIGREFDFSQAGVCGQIQADRALLTVRNMSRETFTYYRPGSVTPEPFPPGNRVKLAPGYRILFGANGYEARMIV